MFRWSLLRSRAGTQRAGSRAVAIFTGFSAVSAISFFGCKGPPSVDTAPAASTRPSAAPAAPPAPVDKASAGAAEARKIFKSRCVVCHGETGTGNGPGAAALNPKPRNYTDPAWQKATPDEEIHKAILLGGAAVGKSSAMPANPDLNDKPEVVDGLVAIVRSFGQAS